MDLYNLKKKKFPNCTKYHIVTAKARNSPRAHIHISDNYQREQPNVSTSLCCCLKYEQALLSWGK